MRTLSWVFIGLGIGYFLAHIAIAVAYGRM